MREKKERKKMNVGDVVHVVYVTGEVFSGEVVKVRSMPAGDGHDGERILFTVKVGDSYRSMYVHKCLELLTLVA